MVHFGHMYDVCFELAHGTTSIWTYSYAQRVGKPIIGYSLRALISSRDDV